MSLQSTAAPADLESFWSSAMDELAALPVAAELTVNHLRSTDFATLFDLKLTSVGPYRIHAFYSVPTGEGPFPALFLTGGYGSVVHIASYEQRQQFVTVSLRARGKRLSDVPYAAAFPGMLTDGIDDPASYVFRGVVADCCRVIDFLLTSAAVDGNKIAVVGDEMALLTAALRTQVDAVYASPALFYGASQLAPSTDAYPLEELNDYARTYPDKAAAMWRTLDYFDPIHLAAKIKAATVLVTGNDRDLFSPAVVAPLAGALGGEVTQVVSAHSSYKDGLHQATWLADRYGLGEPVLPPHWQ